MIKEHIRDDWELPVDGTIKVAGVSEGKVFASKHERSLSYTLNNATNLFYINLFAFLIHYNPQYSVRRISVKRLISMDDPQKISYEKLTMECVKLFRLDSTDGADLKFVYMDEDGDAVTFSTDYELMDAWRHVGGNTFKLKISGPSAVKETTTEYIVRELLNSDEKHVDHKKEALKAVIDRVMLEEDNNDHGVLAKAIAEGCVEDMKMMFQQNRGSGNGWKGGRLGHKKQKFAGLVKFVLKNEKEVANDPEAMANAMVEAMKVKKAMFGKGLENEEEKKQTFQGVIERVMEDSEELKSDVDAMAHAIANEMVKEMMSKHADWWKTKIMNVVKLALDKDRDLKNDSEALTDIILEVTWKLRKSSNHPHFHHRHHGPHHHGPHHHGPHHHGPHHHGPHHHGHHGPNHPSL